jgi:hypothetical protein
LSGFGITHLDPLAETPARSFPICDSDPLRFLSSRVRFMLGRTASLRRVTGRAVLRRLVYFVPLLWLAAVVGGLGALEAYKSRPGAAGQTPAVFPREFPQWESGSDGQSTSRLLRPRLIMFVHPRCPCSKASVGELAEILARRSGQVDAAVVFVKPAGAGPDWNQTSLRSQAAAIPHVRLIDDDGTLARRFGAETSGSVVLYDADGKLLFSGGITRSRGHEGDSAGSRAICALLDGNTEVAAGVHAPVFGCPLFSPGACAQAACPADRTGTSP